MNVSGPTYFACNWCDPSKPLKCGADGITAVKKHDTSVKHINMKKSINENQNLFAMCHKARDVETQTKELALQITAFIAQNDLPLSLAASLLDWLKNMRFDKTAIDKTTCDRTKCTALLKGVLGRSSCDSLVNHLQERFFSLIIDESTDISTSKHLALCVRISVGNTTSDEFLALLEV